MSKTIQLTHEYDASPDAVWQVATDFDAFVAATKRLVTFEGLPDGEMYEGQKIDVRFRLLGIMPPQPYHMEVVTYDPAARMFQSREGGGPVKLWAHHLKVEPTETGARLIDTVEIDAGWLTRVYVWFGRFMYRQRHPVRVRLLQEMKQGEA